MGTSASITTGFNDLVLNGMEEGMTRFRAVTVHLDGYYDTEHGVGQILLKYYNTQEKVDELISNGCMSTLRKEINPNPEEKHTFSRPQKDVCVFYYRDRGEDLTIYEYKNEEEMNYETCEDYNYWFRDGKWYVKRYGDGSWNDLEKCIRNLNGRRVNT